MMSSQQYSTPRGRSIAGFQASPATSQNRSAHAAAVEHALRVGLREGHGRFIAKNRMNPTNFEYLGDWRDNCRNGFGRCYYYNGDLYEGQWLHDKRHGKGKAFLQSGERYVGLWEADMRHG